MSVDPSLNISDRIRALARAGHSRAEIARLVDRSYQQVRQVLVADEARARRALPDATGRPPGVSELAAPFERRETATFIHGVARLPVAADGSVVLPASVVASIMAGPGHVMIGRVVLEGMLLMGPQVAMDMAREGIPPWRAGRPLWSDELIAERRAEAAREAQDD